MKILVWHNWIANIGSASAGDSSLHNPSFRRGWNQRAMAGEFDNLEFITRDPGDTALSPQTRQALYHALLKDALQKAPGWQAWESDGQQARIGLEHPGHQRRIRLQPADSQVVQVELDEPQDDNQQGHQEKHEEPPLLTLHIPDRLSAEQHARLTDILHAWAYDLLPAAPMRARFILPVDNHQPS